jgi:uncharacterized membrane protein YoaK (UPF0700 family)
LIFSNRRLFIFALSLTFLAGFVDALGFIKLGGVFLSFMSGNSTRLSVMSVETGGWAAILPGVIILLFVAGVAAGSYAARRAGGRHAPAVLALVALLLTAAAAGHMAEFDAISIACMTLAMGAANMVFARGGETGPGITYMTGTLVKIGQSIASFLAGERKPGILRYIILWMALLTGAGVGTFSYHAFGMTSLWGAVIFSLGLYALARRKIGITDI